MAIERIKFTNIMCYKTAVICNHIPMIEEIGLVISFFLNNLQSHIIRR